MKSQTYFIQKYLKLHHSMFAEDIAEKIQQKANKNVTIGLIIFFFCFAHNYIIAVL